MIVVADAGPLIHLAAIGRLELVAAVGDVLIPPGVHQKSSSSAWVCPARER